MSAHVGVPRRAARPALSGLGRRGRGCAAQTGLHPTPHRQREIHRVRKLTLDPDGLRVATFEAGEALDARGTVEAHEVHVACPSAGYPLSCATQHTCASFDISCRAENV